MARIQDNLISDDENRDKVNDLKLNLDTINEKLKKSEQAKEHWKLECQLLQMKLTKLKKSTETDVAAHDENQRQQKCQEGEENNGDKLNLEDLIENPIKTKIDELISEKLLADSKATQFYLECLALQRRLQYWEKCKIKAEHALKSAQNDIEELKQVIIHSS